MCELDFAFNFTVVMSRHNTTIINKLPPAIEQLTVIVKPEVAYEGDSEGLLILIDERW